MCRLTCVGQETAKELDLGIEIVHECSVERDYSILSIFGGELLRVSYEEVTSFFASYN